MYALLFRDTGRISEYLPQILIWLGQIAYDSGFYPLAVEFLSASTEVGHLILEADATLLAECFLQVCSRYSEV